jgi:GTP-binding protein
VDRIHFLFGQMEYAPIVPVCSLDGSGVDKQLDTALRMYSQLTRRVETGPLHQALEKWLEDFPPPSGPYALQDPLRHPDDGVTGQVHVLRFPSRGDQRGLRRLPPQPDSEDLGYSMVPVG